MDKFLKKYLVLLQKYEHKDRGFYFWQELTALLSKEVNIPNLKIEDVIVYFLQVKKEIELKERK